jgi:hypothetical protein
MKILLILAASIFLFLSCGSSPKLPKFPDITDHWVVEVREEQIFNFEQPISEEQIEFLESIVNLEEIPRLKENEVARCLKFEIVSKIPYQIKFLQQEPMKSCNLVGGYKPKDSVSLYNWLDDVKAAVEKYKHCFK